MATANLNKSEELVTNTTTASKYIYSYLRDAESVSMEIPPFRDPNLLSKSTLKCVRFEVRFTS